MSKVTNKELIDYCNSMNPRCEGRRCKYLAECDAYFKKYNSVPAKEDFYSPENYKDEMIVAESEDAEWPLQH